jgi:hypothetical protein
MEVVRYITLSWRKKDRTETNHHRKLCHHSPLVQMLAIQFLAIQILISRSADGANSCSIVHIWQNYQLTFQVCRLIMLQAIAPSRATTN